MCLSRVLRSHAHAHAADRAADKPDATNHVAPLAGLNTHGRGKGGPLAIPPSARSVIAVAHRALKLSTGVFGSEGAGIWWFLWSRTNVTERLHVHRGEEPASS